MNERPWHRFYGDMPATIDYPENTLYDSLVESATSYPAYSVYDFLGHRRSYRSFLSEVKRVSRGLWALGLRPGHRICTLMPNSPHIMLLLYAANRIGAVLSVFHADSGSFEVNHLIADFEPHWAVVSDEHLAGFQRVSSVGTVHGVLRASLTDYASKGRIQRLWRLRRRYSLDLEGLRGPVGLSSAAMTPGMYELPPTFSWQSMTRLGAKQGDLPLQAELHRPDECAVVLYTGGTTGRPRGVMLSDRNLDAAARQMQFQGPVLPGQRLLSVVPFSHGLGLGISVHTVVVAAGESTVVPHYTFRTVVRTFRRKRPDYLTGVPSFYAGLLLDRKFHRTRLDCLMAAFCGGDRLPAHVRDKFEITVRRRGGAVPIREGYGLTETVTACATAPDDANRSGSVGVPYPDTDIRIAAAGDANDLQELPAGELGEICVSGPTVMLGYWKPEDGAHIVVDAAGRRWLRTGDLGRMDGDGYLYFVERTGRSAKLEGEAVYPGMVEDALHMHPEVRQACVAIRDTDDGAVLVATVVPIDFDLDTEWMETTLRNWCAQELGERQRPAKYVFAHSLPYTRLGVVDYRRVEASLQAANG